MGVGEFGKTFTISPCFNPYALMYHSHMIAILETKERVYNYANGDKDGRVQASITRLSLAN